MPPISSQVNDFSVLPLAIPPTSSFPLSTTHYAYVRPHVPSIPTPEAPRSLFLTNTPIDSTSAHFRALFASKSLGGARLETVQFDDSKPSKRAGTPFGQKSRKRKRFTEEDLDPNLPATWDREVHRSGSTAVVVFIDRANKELAMKAVKKASQSRRAVPWPIDEVAEKLPPLGSARYKTNHALQFPESERLQSAVDAYMTAFGSLEQTQSRAAAAARQVPDEDGFVTVTRGAKVGPAAVDTARSEGLKERLEAKRRKEEKKGEGLRDFYRFQNRDRKKVQQGDLVRRFEDDRKRVSAMKGRGGRSFKPE